MGLFSSGNELREKSLSMAKLSKKGDCCAMLGPRNTAP